MTKLKVGDKAPDFTLPSHLDKNVTLSHLAGKTVVLAFFPRAWTPVCTDQIPSYEAEYDKFAALNVQVLGISIDHVPSLKAWAESLGGITTFPILSDFWPHGAVAERYGVLRPEGYTERAVFIIDQDGYIRYIDIHDISEQPDNNVLFAELGRIIPDGEARLKAITKPPENVVLPHGGVVMYCTPWCPDCRKAREWLKKHNIEYTEVNIVKTAGASEQVRQWANGSQTTPTFDIDGQIVVDFDLPRLEQILKVK